MAVNNFVIGDKDGFGFILPPGANWNYWVFPAERTPF
jgi:hypothetical protein